jgi:hypothetical protein
MYDLSTSLGFAIGPLIGSSLQVALGGGTLLLPPSLPPHPIPGASGFTRACFILGIVYSLSSMSVLHLRSVGRRLGEDSLELEGSLYGRSLLDANDPSDLHFFTTSSAAHTATNATTSPSSSRNLFESSFRDNLFSNSSSGFSLGLSSGGGGGTGGGASGLRDEDSAVF